MVTGMLVPEFSQIHMLPVADALLLDAIQQAHAADPHTPPLVMDVGANHGIYSLYAAALGALVIVVEPQRSLCQLINFAASQNGVRSRIRVFNAAVLDTRGKMEHVGLVDAHRGEGAVAHLQQRGKARRDNTFELVAAYPMSAFVPAWLSQRISFLKLDVEGFELHALVSAFTLFGDPAASMSQQYKGRGRAGVAVVENVVVEYGPPDRWREVAGDRSADGVAVLEQLRALGFEARLVDSQVWNAALVAFGQQHNLRASAEWGRVRGTGQSVGSYIALPRNEVVETLIQTMQETRSEAYLWFTRQGRRQNSQGDHTTASWPTFVQQCAVAAGVAVYGCTTTS